MKATLIAPAIAVVLLAACAAAGYRSGCYEVLVGCLDVDLAGGSWSFGGLCIEKLHESCPDLKDFKFEAGVDRNGNGTLDPDERTIHIDDPNPGSVACAGAGAGELGPDDKGRKILYHYECSKGDESRPFVSKNGEKEVE